MSPDAYKQALEKALTDLTAARTQRDRWTLEVARLQQLVKSLAVMTAKTTRVSVIAQAQADWVGMQDVVLSCIGMSPMPLSAIDVRERLTSLGYDLSRYANALAVIHGAMKRLETAGRIKRIGHEYVAARFAPLG